MQTEIFKNLVTWDNFQIVIPLIVVLVTILYNSGKERRDRNYEFRPIPAIFSTTNLNQRNTNEVNIIYNSNLFDVDIVNEAHFFIIQNISKTPMLSVTIDVYYYDDFPVQKYKILMIKEAESYIIPASPINRNTYEALYQTKGITVTYRSLSGQKYEAKTVGSKLTLIAKKNFFRRERIIELNDGERKSEFKKL